VPADEPFEIIWTRPSAGRRGPRPAWTRAEIAAEAVRLADAEGLEAASVRRVGAELGGGATSLYRYVTSREELYDLMVDHVAAEILPGGHAGDWRADLRRLAEGTRAMARRHPWAPALVSARPTLGPNNLDLMEFCLEAVDGVFPDVDHALSAISTVLAFTWGAVLAELAEQEATRRTGIDRERWMAAQTGYAGAVVAAGRHPQVVRVWTDAELPHDPAGADRQFAFGLERVLDGLDAVTVAPVLSFALDPEPAPDGHRPKG
jgi:AcrR family transcriptional regulator